MAIKIRINGGWLYLAPKEKYCIESIIKELENNAKSDMRLHTSYFIDKLKVSDKTTAHALFLLMGAHIIKPQQYGRLRLWSLIPGWRARFKQKTSKIGKDKIEND